MNTASAAPQHNNSCQHCIGYDVDNLANKDLEKYVSPKIEIKNSFNYLKKRSSNSKFNSQIKSTNNIKPTHKNHSLNFKHDQPSDFPNLVNPSGTNFINSLRHGYPDTSMSFSSTSGHSYLQMNKSLLSMPKTIPNNSPTTFVPNQRQSSGADKTNMTSAKNSTTSSSRPILPNLSSVKRANMPLKGLAYKESKDRIKSTKGSSFIVDGTNDDYLDKMVTTARGDAKTSMLIHTNNESNLEGFLPTSKPKYKEMLKNIRKGVTIYRNSNENKTDRLITNNNTQHTHKVLPRDSSGHKQNNHQMIKTNKDRKKLNALNLNDNLKIKGDRISTLDDEFAVNKPTISAKTNNDDINDTNTDFTSNTDENLTKSASTNKPDSGESQNQSNKLDISVIGDSSINDTSFGSNGLIDLMRLNTTPDQDLY